MSFSLQVAVTFLVLDTCTDFSERVIGKAERYLPQLRPRVAIAVRMETVLNMIFAVLIAAVIREHRGLLCFCVSVYVLVLFAATKQRLRGFFTKVFGKDAAKQD